MNANVLTVDVPCANGSRDTLIAACAVNADGTSVPPNLASELRGNPPANGVLKDLVGLSWNLVSSNVAAIRTTCAFKSLGVIAAAEEAAGAFL